MTHILTGLTVLALIACAWLLPVLLWDVLTLDPATPEDRRGRPAVRGHTVSGPVIYARPRSVQP